MRKIEYNTENYFIELAETNKSLRNDVDFLYKLREIIKYGDKELNKCLFRLCIDISNRIKENSQMYEYLKKIKQEGEKDETNI